MLLCLSIDMLLLVKEQDEEEEVEDCIISSVFHYYLTFMRNIPPIIIEEADASTTPLLRFITQSQFFLKYTSTKNFFRFSFSHYLTKSHNNKNEHDIPHLHLQHREEKILLWKNRPSETLQIQHLTKIKW